MRVTDIKFYLRNIITPDFWDSDKCRKPRRFVKTCFGVLNIPLEVMNTPYPPNIGSHRKVPFPKARPLGLGECPTLDHSIIVAKRNGVIESSIT